MLKQRVITGLILVAIFLVTLLLLPTFYLGILCFVAVCIGAFEWSAFGKLEQKNHRFFYTFIFACIFVLVAYMAGFNFKLTSLSTDIYGYQVLFNIGAFFWLFALMAVVGYPGWSKLWARPFIILILGAVLLTVAGLAFLFLRLQVLGHLWILYSVAIVVAADVGAYFVGRTLGERKLAAVVSPGKSWEGFWGGFVLAQAVAIIFYLLVGHQMLDDAIHSSLAQFMGVAAVLSSVSVLGDLFESMLKREASVKDSGAILPGHGGVLDRIDGLIAAVPLLAFFHLNLGW